MLQQCNLSELAAVTVDFYNFNQIPPNYECFLATEAGIPGDVVNSIMDQVRSGEYYETKLQRHFLQTIGDRATKISDFSLKGFITEGGGDCDFEFAASQLVKLPLQNMHLDLYFDYESGLSLYEEDFNILSETIESFTNLENLQLCIPGDCGIRSKSLRQLEYMGDNELVECECPLLESMELTIMGPTTLQLLSKFAHSVKNLYIHFQLHGLVERTERLTQIIRAMPLLEELRIDDYFLGCERINQFLDIKSESLRRIKLESCRCRFYLSSCICPKLETIQCDLNAPMMTCPLIPVDEGIFHSLIISWDDKW
eukprot:CAMPEP_0176494808 /NCGR_PEP_ID=MMETSP0200_2-20121128/10312_1 /TAXON_ID=947934 /ORGANISM="Chaetoceros sp., Strain GSL56" /LENGTH=311 /DNA_ID=CAMNT_0017892627 /DNA_START=577 /DNA_END=1509 /DNA_ORIENTATION=+